MTTWLDLALAWGKVGLFGFGGGPSFIPLVRVECVERHGWMTDEEFLDALAFGNALPGPIALKLAGYVGLKVGGPVGAVVAMLALTAPGVLLMIALMGAYIRYRDAPAMAGVLRGVRPAVVGLLAWTAWSLAPDGVRGWSGAAVAGGAFLALALDVHPAIVMVAAVVIGALVLR